MQLNKYVEWTGNTCASLDSKLMDDLHMLLGLATEIGELQDVYKKHIAYGTSLDVVNIKEEVGDIMFYVASFCRMNHFDLEKILETNRLKLESRYPNKFSSKNALNRNLEKERDILEK